MKPTLSAQREWIRGGTLRTLEARLSALERLSGAIQEEEAALLEALQADLGKSAVEAYTSEVGFVLRDITHAKSQLRSWMKGRRCPVPLITRRARAKACRNPSGSC